MSPFCYKQINEQMNGEKGKALLYNTMPTSKYRRDEGVRKSSIDAKTNG